jgi:DNA-binding GntR family transcriptional regulator
MAVGAILLQSKGLAAEGRPERGAIRDWVLTKLYERIFSGSLPPGVNFSEADLSEALNVSRQPIRDALRQLESDGLITPVAGNGVRSAVAFNRKHVVELYSMRAALESLSSRQAASRISDAQLAELSELQGQLEEGLVQSASVHTRYDPTLDFRFHQIVAESSGMPQLCSFLVSIGLKTWALLTQLDVAGTYPNKLDIDESYLDRRELLDALTARNANRAANAAARHVNHRMDDLLSAIDSGRGTFRLRQ